ncbi:MAG: hydroxyacid dehydrogenase [Lachnospiraceae bacterium]|nr:hydroxyacid dehydrogenase [Lachnospiraceae bacterium]
MKSVFICNDKNNYKKVYSDNTIEFLKVNAGFIDEVYDKEYVMAHIGEFFDVEFIFSTWGMPTFTEIEIKQVFPNLKCVFYAAGTVQFFARPFINCGVRVFSAWSANAIPVAEYTVAQIILAGKRFFSACKKMSEGETKEAYIIRENYIGNYDSNVGIVGAGMIGAKVCEMLKNYKLNVKVFDPFLSDEKAKQLGVQKVELDELFSTCNVVSNHLANNEQTQGIFVYKHFMSMPKYATFINTGRGAQVVENDLARALNERNDLAAVLDVTAYEPLQTGHPFFSLNNCFITPHIAGSGGRETFRMAEYIAEEFIRYISGDTLTCEVNNKMLETMA